jgi:L-lactate dehydrogenase complex protein LldE
MKVSIFVTCLVDQFHPEVAEGMVRVLDRLGLAYDVPEGQTCCGQPALNAGFPDEARTVGRQWLRAFERAELIVAPSGSCVSMVRRHLPALFETGSREHEVALGLAGRVYELSQFLVDVLHVDDVGARFAHRVTYHDSCHLLRELGVASQPRRLLAHVDGLELVEMPGADACCGFGGLFAVKEADISGAMGHDKLTRARETGAEALVAGDTGCLMHLRGLLARGGGGLRALHLAEVLGSDRSGGTDIRD